MPVCVMTDLYKLKLHTKFEVAIATAVGYRIKRAPFEKFGINQNGEAVGMKNGRFFLRKPLMELNFGVGVHGDE